MKGKNPVLKYWGLENWGKVSAGPLFCTTFGGIPQSSGREGRETKKGKRLGDRKRRKRGREEKNGVGGAKKCLSGFLNN